MLLSTGRFILQPEKVPEYVVPDLVDCEVIPHIQLANLKIAVYVWA